MGLGMLINCQYCILLLGAWLCSVYICAYMLSIEEELDQWLVRST